MTNSQVAIKIPSTEFKQIHLILRLKNVQFRFFKKKKKSYYSKLTIQI